MKAIEVKSTRIHCDECHHEFAGEPPDWHNKPCPECGEGVLITDDDMTVWQGCRAAMDLLNELAGDMDDSGGTFTVRIDTSDLRHNT